MLGQKSYRYRTDMLGDRPQTTDPSNHVPVIDTKGQMASRLGRAGVPMCRHAQAFSLAVPEQAAATHFFLSELSVSGGMPTTVTVPCSMLRGAAITRGSSLQRRFFVYRDRGTLSTAEWSTLLST